MSQQESLWSTLKNTALKDHGLTEKSSQGKPLLGYSDTETVKLDLDGVSFRTAKHWALKSMKQFKLGGLIILKSSERCYHVVFDRRVSWAENMHVVAWVSLLSKNRGILRWLPMQCIKESSTLRVSPKKDKPSPRVVYRYGKQYGQIRSFLEYRQKIKSIIARRAGGFGKVLL